MISFDFIRRVGLAFAVLFLTGVAACTDAPTTDSAEQAVGGAALTTDQSTYAPAAAITVNWTGTPGSANDWVALVPMGSPPNSGFLEYAFSNGQVNGSHAFAGLDIGAYEARFYAAGTYTVLASATFTVASGGGGGTVTVTTDKAIYQAQQPITVNWMGTPGDPDDWIAIATAGAPPNSVLTYTFTNGQVDGNHAFGGLSVGNYEARAYQHGTYTIIGSSTFSVTDISLDHPSYAINQPITVSWTNLPGNPNDYVSINTAGSPPNSGFLQQFVTAGAVNGSQLFTGLAAGTYEARTYLGGGFTMLATVTFTVAGTAPPGPTVTTNLATYTPSQAITVTWAGLPGNSNDWIALVVAGSPPNSGFVTYALTNGLVGGSMTFASGIAAEGMYEARAYRGGSYTVLATSNFTVSTAGGSGCVPSTNPPVVGSITSGDLVLDATHNVNTVALTTSLTSSVLFTSTSENEPSPAYGAVMCALHDVDTTDMLPAGITCRRTSVGTDTGNGTVTVHYSVVAFTSGVTVQRGTSNTGFGNPVVSTISTVTPANTFVLLNGITNNGSGWGNNEFVRADLTDAQTLTIRTNVPGTNVSWQVVSMTGASVQRGSAAFASGDLQQAVTISAVPTGSMVLASYSTNVSSASAAALMMQSSLSDPTTILLSRDLAGAALDVSWEVVSLPFATDFGLTTFAAGEASRTETVPNIAPSSSVAICSSQSILGQSGGSTSYQGADVDLVGEAAVTLATGTNTLLVTRGTSQAAAEIPWTVIDFAHNCNGQ